MPSTAATSAMSVATRHKSRAVGSRLICRIKNSWPHSRFAMSVRSWSTCRRVRRAPGSSGMAGSVPEDGCSAVNSRFPIFVTAHRRIYGRRLIPGAAAVRLPGWEAAIDRGCGKTPAFDLRVESSSRYDQSENKSSRDSYPKKAIEETILRFLCSRTFSHGLDPLRTFGGGIMTHLSHT